MDKLQMYIKMCQLKVVDNDGNEWMPVWGYDGEICAYAPRDEALKALVTYDEKFR